MRGSITALVLNFLLLPVASACSCAPITLQKSAKNADSIFFATLEEAKLVSGAGKDWYSIEGKFLVYKTLKGSPPAGPIFLRTPPDGSSCGINMIVAAKYVIFKRRDSDGLIACDGSGVLGHFGPVSRWDEDEVTVALQKAVPKTRRQH